MTIFLEIVYINFYIVKSDRHDLIKMMDLASRDSEYLKKRRIVWKNI